MMMIVSKKIGKKFDQKMYDFLFFNIENNLRELGFGDVTVNKKMKDFNKILYDILLKIEAKNEEENFRLDPKLVFKYFAELNIEKSKIFEEFDSYFVNFFQFCFELPLENMVREAIKFKLIMAVPKRKTSVSKKRMRRSHHKLSSVNVVEDKKSGEYKLSHHIDLKSGYYNGKKILDI